MAPINNRILVEYSRMRSNVDKIGDYNTQRYLYL